MTLAGGPARYREPLRFHLVLLRTDNYPHTLVFLEQLALLEATFRDLHIDFTTGGELDPDRINVLLGYQLLKSGPSLARFAYIPFQFEVLGPGGSCFDTPNSWQVLRDAMQVWDFSEHNVEHLRAAGIAATSFPVGYHEALEIVPRVDEDLDVLLSGSQSTRREHVLRRIADTGVVVAQMFGQYGQAKQESLARARIHLQVHYGETRLLCTCRTAHLLNNARFVISEAFDDNPYPKIELVQVPYDELPAATAYYLRHPAERARVAEENHKQFKRHYRMTDIMRRALNQLMDVDGDTQPSKSPHALEGHAVRV